MDITYSIEVDVEELPVRGNAMASGDPDVDKACEDEILRRLERGDIWAWCSVRVVARVESDAYAFEGFATLGGCSYRSEGDFKDDAYYYDMKREALEDLKKMLKSEIDEGEEANRLYDAILSKLKLD